MPDAPSDTAAKLATTRAQVDKDVKQLRAIWLGLAQTSAIIERATLTCKDSLELLNRET